MTYEWRQPPDPLHCLRRIRWLPAPAQQPRPGSFRRDWNAVVCFSCGNAGHSTTRCPTLDDLFPFMLPGWKAEKTAGVAEQVVDDATSLADAGILFPADSAGTLSPPDPVGILFPAVPAGILFQADAASGRSCGDTVFSRP